MSKKCPTCNSTGFEPSVVGEGRCSFCDGTFGGHPPKAVCHQINNAHEVWPPRLLLAEHHRNEIVEFMQEDAPSENQDNGDYTRTDEAQAMVAAAYEAAKKAAFHACKSAGAGYVDENERLLQRAENEFRLEVVKAIRALTPTDAKAALDRILQEAVKEALQVKPLVWGYHPMGQMASTGMGTAYIIDTRDAPRIRWGKWPGGHGPERETLAEMQYAAQADYEARILSALKGGEA